MYMCITKSRRGFTFIELAVSIAIIGVLSAVILSSVNGARKSGRVAQRVGDIKRVQAALDLYYAKNRSYPSTGGSTSWRSTCPAWGSLNKDNVIMDVNTSVKLVPTYLTVMPEDPQRGSAGTNQNCYLYTSNGTDYAFLIHDVTDLSNGSAGATYAKYPELIDPARDSGASASVVDGTGIWAWKVSSPGGVTW